jgi:hypothetical protein
MGDYAKTLGTTAEALDKTQKMQALLNEVMRQAGTMTAGAGMPSGAAMAQAQLQRAQEESQVAVGNFFAPMVREVLQDQVEIIQLLTGKWDALAKAQSNARDEMADNQGLSPEELERMGAYVEAIDAVDAAVARGIPYAKDYGNALQGMAAAAENGDLSDAQANQIRLITNALADATRAFEAEMAAALDAGDALEISRTKTEGMVGAVDQTNPVLAEMAAKLGWVGQAALAAATDVASFNAEVARIQGAISVTQGIKSAGLSKVQMLAGQALDEGVDPATVRQMVTDATAAVEDLILAVDASGVAQFDNKLKVDDATTSMESYVDGVRTANSESKKLAAGGLADINKAYDDIKSKASSVITGALQTDVKVENQPYQDGINENSKRLADIANKGFAGQSWMEEFKTEAAGVYEELKKVEEAGGDVKAKAAEIFANVQAGLDLRTLDRGMIKQRVKDMILGDQNVAALAAEIAQELSQEMGVPLAQVQATTRTALGLPTEDSAGAGKGGAETKGDTGKATGQAAGGAFGTGFIAGIDGPAIAASAIASIAVGFLLNEKKVRGSGAVVGAWWGEGFMGTVGENVPPGLLEMLVAKLLPAILAAIAAKNAQGKPDDGSGGPP